MTLIFKRPWRIFRMIQPWLIGCFGVICSDSILIFRVAVKNHDLQILTWRSFSMKRSVFSTNRDSTRFRPKNIFALFDVTLIDRDWGSSRTQFVFNVFSGFFELFRPLVNVPFRKASCYILNVLAEKISVQNTYLSQCYQLSKTNYSEIKYICVI